MKLRETGWPQTGSTATQSRVFSLSVEAYQISLNKPGNAPLLGGGSA